jgi:acetyl/propionyl-CoA carboxylase alpha subunit
MRIRTPRSSNHSSRPVSFFLPRRTVSDRVRAAQQEKYEKLKDRYSVLSPEAARIHLKQKLQIRDSLADHPEKNDELLDLKIQALRSLINPKFPAICVLNRGVIAKKIIEVAKKKHLETFLICHTRDSNSVASKIADHTFLIENPMDLSEIAATLLSIKQQLPYPIAIHPGYGYLSEDPTLPMLCDKLDLVFIGPNALTMDAFGNKANARKIARAVNVPVVPGYEDHSHDVSHLLAEAQKIGYPIMAKTTDGGGGTGNRVVTDPHQLKLLLENTFKNKKVIFERFLNNQVRHFEIQLAIDNDDTVAILGSRDCSFQKHFQKVIELAPAQTSNLADLERYAKKLGEEAAKQGYRNVLTVEFLDENGTPYFNEINTRIQVEHGPTEDIHGKLINIVELQLAIASGTKIKDYLASKLKDIDSDDFEKMSAQEMIDHMRAISPIKYSIEARINALETQVYEGKLFQGPTRGTVSECQIPATINRGSIECGIDKGNLVDSSEVNPNIILACGNGQDLEEASQNLQTLLGSIVIEGINTNISYLQLALRQLSRNGFIANLKTSQEVDRCYVDERTLEVNPRMGYD